MACSFVILLPERNSGRIPSTRSTSQPRRAISRTRLPSTSEVCISIHLGLCKANGTLETKPLPKPHFAALTLQPTAAKPATTVVQAINGGATINNGSHDTRPPIHHGRPSMLPKVPRASMLALESNRHPVIKTEDTSGEKRLTGRVQRPSNTALPPNLNTQVC